MSIIPDSLDTMARKIRAAMPDDLNDLSQDLKKNIRACMDATLARLDLVTREEFETQRELIARLSERVESLVAKLEAAAHADGSMPSGSARKTPKH